MIKFVISTSGSYEKYEDQKNIIFINDKNQHNILFNKINDKKQYNQNIINLDSNYDFSIFNMKPFNFDKLNIKYGITKKSQFYDHFPELRRTVSFVSKVYKLYYIYKLPFDGCEFEYLCYTMYEHGIIPILKSILIGQDKFIKGTQSLSNHFPGEKVFEQTMRDIHGYFKSIWLRDDIQRLYNQKYYNIKVYMYIQNRVKNDV